MSKKRPNILLLFVDQLRWDYVHSYGINEWIQTPNIDSIGINGCRYDNAYSPNPVCIPARHNMITGLPCRYHGFDDNYFGAEAKNCPWYLPTFAQICSDAGYSTFAVGKMHFQPERRATGFDSFLNMDEVISDVMEDDYALFLREKGYGNVGSIHGVRNVLYQQPQQSLLPDELTGSYWVADRTIDIIRNRGDQERPFLIWTGFIQPHPPLSSPHSFSHLYDGKVPKHTSSVTPLSRLCEELKCIADLPDEENINRMRENYAGAVSWVDFNIGRILQALRESGLEDDTAVIFTSDHGEMLGDLDTYQKMNPHEPSTHIPFLMQWPGHIEPGTVRKDFIDLNDILPTFADLAGTEYPADYDLPGESLFAIDPQKDRNVVYAEHQKGDRRWCMIRDSRYKLIHYYGDDDQLFDLENDPDELVNLLYEKAEEEEVKAVLDRLYPLLIQYEKKWGLPGCIKDGQFVDFPPFEMKSYYESCFPNQVKKLRGDPPFDDLGDEVIAAIADEPTVHLSALHVREIMKEYGGYTDQEVDLLLEKAKNAGRY
ncbi:MAG: sulfatase-like hydrolase/transferase [Oscillospiraceae bacterium]|nr:sulfatase-like hydrolase/transferase [Oscillospiraceae bacterium]